MLQEDLEKILLRLDLLWEDSDHLLQAFDRIVNPQLRETFRAMLLVVASRLFLTVELVQSFCEAEIDVVIDILFDHLDSDGMNTVARRTAFRLLECFAYASPDKTTVDEVVADSGFDLTWDIEALMRSIMVHDAFFETAAAAPFIFTTKKSVKWPIDYVVTTMRLTRMKAKTNRIGMP